MCGDCGIVCNVTVELLANERAKDVLSFVMAILLVCVFFSLSSFSLPFFFSLALLSVLTPSLRLFYHHHHHQNHDHCNDLEYFSTPMRLL